jgi:uncharacterized protein (TIGR03086 family)
MQTIDDLRPLDAAAVRLCGSVVQRITPADLGRPTPCAGWAVRDLLAHLTGQHLGFAAAAEGRGADPAAWQPRPAADPVAAHADSVERVLAAFTAEGVLDRPFDLPDFGPGARFPGARAIAFHTLDYAVHGWDVARSLGRPYALPDDLAAACLRLARLVPDGEGRRAPGAAFAPGLDVPAGSDALTETLLRLGRDPAWAPPAG